MYFFVNLWTPVGAKVLVHSKRRLAMEFNWNSQRHIFHLRGTRGIVRVKKEIMRIIFKKSNTCISNYRLYVIHLSRKNVKMIVFKFCKQTQRTITPVSRFPAIAYLCSQSDSFAREFRFCRLNLPTVLKEQSGSLTLG